MISHTIISFLIFPFAAAALTFALTKILILVLPKFGFLDIPHGRHEHESPTPRGGGIAIIIGFLTIFVLYSLSELGTFPTFFLKSLIPGGMVLILGVLDDRFELAGLVKLLSQLLIGGTLWAIGGGIDILFGCELPVWAALPMTIIWTIAIMNAFNLIDGLDGLAAGLAVISSGLIAFWNLLSGGSPFITVVLLMFCGSCLGFLKLNFHPAKIFMGDTGSLFIGLFFAGVSMQQTTKSVTLPAMLVPVLAMGIPMFDVFLAVWRRSVRHVGIMKGDHDHLAHRIQAATGSQTKTAIILYGVSGGITLGAMVLAVANRELLGFTFVILLAGIFVMIRIFAKIEIHDSVSMLVHGFAIPRRSTVMILFHPFIDLCILLFSAGFALFLTEGKLFEPDAASFMYILVFTVPPFLTLLFSGIYATYWLRGGSNRYYQLFRNLFIGILLSAGIMGILWKVQPSMLPEGNGILRFYVAALTTFTLMASERLILYYFIGYMLYRIHHENAAKAPCERVVVFGGGLDCNLYLKKVYMGTKNFSMDICGIIDDNPALRNINVYGLDVLGNSNELEQILEKTPFDKIILTAQDPEPAVLDKLKSFCETHGISLCAFRTEEIQLFKVKKP